MTELGRVCEHGRLARQCEICERDREIARLREALERIAAEPYWHGVNMSKIALEALEG
jgi:hypothetical protein